MRWDGGCTYDFASRFGRRHEPSADEVGDPRRRRNGHGKRDLVRDTRERRQDALRSEVLGAEATRQQGHDLKRKPLGLDHDHARQRKAHHDPPVRERPATEAAPALRAVDEADVQEQEERQDILRDDHGDGGADEAQLQAPDEQPQQEGVEGRGEQEHVGRGAEQALRLGEALAALEEDEAGDAEDHDAQVQPGEARGLGVRDEAHEDVLGEEPQDGDGEGQQEEEDGHALHLQTD